MIQYFLSYLSLLLFALLLTIAVEGIVILLIFRRKKYIYYSFLCNLLTNPALNVTLMALLALFPQLTGEAFFPTLIVLEIIVVIVEAFVYRYICKFSLPKAVMLSFLLNAASFGAGLAVYNLRLF